jgi:hypothetical protein
MSDSWAPTGIPAIRYLDGAGRIHHRLLGNQAKRRVFAEKIADFDKISNHKQ